MRDGDAAAGVPSATATASLRLVELVGLLFERLVGRDVRRQDAVEVLDLIVLDVVL
jgi:hypothetical protein